MTRLKCSFQLEVYPKSRTSRFIVFDKKGAKKLSVGYGWWDTERILSSHEILVIFSWGQAGEIPLVAFVVIIVGPDTDGLMNLRKAGTAGQVDLILHVAEEALLGCVIPAVGTAGHGLAEPAVLHQLNKLYAGVMGALVTVDQDLGLQGWTMSFHQLIHGLQNGIHLRLWKNCERKLFISAQILTFALIAIPIRRFLTGAKMPMGQEGVHWPPEKKGVM